MNRGDTHGAKAGIELLPWCFTRLVIIWFILLNIILIHSFILITLHDIIFFNTLMTKGMSRNNIVTFCFEFFCNQEYLALLSNTFPNNCWWWKQIVGSPSWPNSPALCSTYISWYLLPVQSTLLFQWFGKTLACGIECQVEHQSNI